MNEAAWQRAMALLDKRDYSRKQLTDKLTEKGISPEDAGEVLSRLCELGVVDDSRYAGMVVRHYAAKGYGERRIRDELYRRGIEKELWDAALEELPEQDDALTALLRTKLRGKELTREELGRASAYAQRRGFGYSEIREALDRIINEE